MTPCMPTCAAAPFASRSVLVLSSCLSTAARSRAPARRSSSSATCANVRLFFSPSAAACAHAVRPLAFSPRRRLRALAALLCSSSSTSARFASSSALPRSPRRGRLPSSSPVYACWRWRETPLRLLATRAKILFAFSVLEKGGSRRRSSCEATRSSPTTTNFDPPTRALSVRRARRVPTPVRRLSGSSPLGLRYFSHSQFSRKGGRGEVTVFASVPSCPLSATYLANHRPNPSYPRIHPHDTRPRAHFHHPWRRLLPRSSLARRATTRSSTSAS